MGGGAIRAATRSILKEPEFDFGKRRNRHVATYRTSRSRAVRRTARTDAQAGTIRIEAETAERERLEKLRGHRTHRADVGVGHRRGRAGFG